MCKSVCLLWQTWVDDTQTLSRHADATMNLFVTVTQVMMYPRNKAEANTTGLAQLSSWTNIGLFVSVTSRSVYPVCTDRELNALHYTSVSVSSIQHGCFSDQSPLLPALPSLHPSLFHCSIFNRIEQMAAPISQACLGRLVLKIQERGAAFKSLSSSLPLTVTHFLSSTASAGRLELSLGSL